MSSSIHTTVEYRGHKIVVYRRGPFDWCAYDAEFRYSLSSPTANRAMKRAKKRVDAVILTDQVRAAAK